MCRCEIILCRGGIRLWTESHCRVLHLCQDGRRHAQHSLGQGLARRPEAALSGAIVDCHAALSDPTLLRRTPAAASGALGGFLAWWCARQALAAAAALPVHLQLEEAVLNRAKDARIPTGQCVQEATLQSAGMRRGGGAYTADDDVNHGATPPTAAMGCSTSGSSGCRVGIVVLWRGHQLREIAPRSALHPALLRHRWRRINRSSSLLCSLATSTRHAAALCEPGCSFVR